MSAPAAVKPPFRPMLATLSREVVTGPQWVFEEKYDGIRALAVRRGREVRLFSRTLRDISAEFPAAIADVGALPGGDVILDGELVGLDRRGVSRFQLLQRRALAGAGRLAFAVFDLLEERGDSLRALPLAERRRALEDLLPEPRGTLLVSRRLARDGRRAYALAQRRGWEGIIAKDDASRYEAGTRSRFWLKVKVRREAEFVIGGWTPPAGSRTRFGALLVGLFDGPRLRFTGKVGTGFTAATLESVGTRLEKLEAAAPPFDPAPRIRDARWAKPRLVAQLAYAEWTADGKLRQPAFLGLRTDKEPQECRWNERE